MVQVTDIDRFFPVNAKLIETTTFTDHVDLTWRPAGDYGLAVYAYLIKAVNRLGVESGPSPYALTIPSEPANVMCRERPGGVAELRWDKNPESAITGYHVYKLEGGVWTIKRVTDQPLTGTTFTCTVGKDLTRFWITAIDPLGQEGQPSSPAWYGKSYKGFYEGDWHQ
jgi:hypothetical protein